LLQNPKLLILKAVIQRIPPHHVFKNIPDEARCQLVAHINKEILLEMSLGLSVDGFPSAFLLSSLKWADGSLQMIQVYSDRIESIFLC